jgi:hypothetical protein
MPDATELFVRSPGALAAEVDGEVVALDVAKGVCYGLNRTGSRVWDLLAEPTSARAICGALAALYDVEPARCEREVLTLLDQLIDEGLAQPVPASAPA